MFINISRLNSHAYNCSNWPASKHATCALRQLALSHDKRLNLLWYLLNLTLYVSDISSQSASSPSVSALKKSGAYTPLWLCKWKKRNCHTTVFKYVLFVTSPYSHESLVWNCHISTGHWFPEHTTTCKHGHHEIHTTIHLSHSQSPDY